MFRPVLALVVLTTAMDAPGQTLAPQGPAARQERSTVAALDRLQVSLQQIATVLRELRTDQRAMLLVRRVELAERRLAPLEDELRQTREEARRIRQQTAQIDGVVNTLREQLDDAVRRGADPQQLPERAELGSLETMLDLHESQLEDAERRIIEAENQLDRRRRAIEILDEKLEALLERMDN